MGAQNKNRQFWKFLYTTCLRGILGILPFTLSVYVVLWFLHSFGTFTDEVVSYLIPSFKGFLGIGFIIGFSIVFFLGLLFSYKKFTDIFTLLQFPFKRIPLIKTVYSAVEDMMFYFSNEESRSKGRVVLVRLPNADMQVMGLLTRDDLSELNIESLKNEKVAVFIPMSYALGGYTVFVPKSSLEMTDLKVEVAMKSALTAWMKKHPSTEHGQK